MVNSGFKDKHVLKMTICKRRDSGDVQRIIAFAYLLINSPVEFICKGQDHCVMISDQSGVRSPRTAVFLCPKHTSSFYWYTLPPQVPNVISVSKQRRSWGHSRDGLALLWQLVTFLVWMLHESLQPLFPPAFRQPGPLYHSPGSAIAHRQSLGNASTLGISSEHGCVLCKCNIQGVNTRGGENVQWRDFGPCASAIQQRNILSFKMLLKARFKWHVTFCGQLLVAREMWGCLLPNHRPTMMSAYASYWCNHT